MSRYQGRNVTLSGGLNVTLSGAKCHAIRGRTVTLSGGEMSRYRGRNVTLSKIMFLIMGAANTSKRPKLMHMKRAWEANTSGNHRLNKQWGSSNVAEKTQTYVKI